MLDFTLSLLIFEFQLKLFPLYWRFRNLKKTKQNKTKQQRKYISLHFDLFDELKGIGYSIPITRTF